MPTPTHRSSWSVEDIRELLAGTVEDGEVAERLRTADRKGMSPVAFAALRAATTADALTPLLGLLEPPDEGGGTSRLDLMLDLLERVAEGQVVLARRMDAIEARLAEWNASSPTVSPTAPARRGSGG